MRTQMVGWHQSSSSPGPARKSPPSREGPLRVLQVTPRYPPDVGGVERHVFEVARRLPSMDIQVTVLCTDRTRRFIGVQNESQVEVRRVRAWPASRDYYLAPGIWRAMSENRWDVIHVQSYHTLVAPLAMLRAVRLGVPFLITFHGGGHSSRMRNMLRPLQRRILGPLLGRAARFVAVARFEIESYGRELGISRDRFALIPNGTAFVKPDAEMHLLTSGQPVIASIGRLERYKGHHRVVGALPHILRRHPHAMLWIVGTGPDREVLRRQAEKLGVGDRVEFRTIPADDPAAMSALLAQTAIVVNMSDFETHPLAALEAVAAGRPLVVSNSTGLSELVADGLARGLPPGSSAEAIAAAVVEELSQKRPPPEVQLSSWDDCARALAALYREVASKH